MKEGEPEDVVPAVSEAELHEGFVGCQPSGGAVDPRALDFGFDDDSDTDTGTQVHEGG